MRPTDIRVRFKADVDYRDGAMREYYLAGAARAYAWLACTRPYAPCIDREGSVLFLS